MTAYIRHHKWILLATLATTAFAIPALASPSVVAEHSATRPNLGIAAVVGEEAISSYDVDNRVKFIIATAHLSDTSDVVAHIRPQVVRSLIDEKLQVQEAKKNDVTVSDDDVKQAVAAIEEQRSMPPGTIFHILDSVNLPHDVFTQQIRAQLLWNRLLTKKIRPQVRISDSEITMAGHQFVPPPPKREAEAIPQEFKIALIALPVDKPSRDKEIHGLADKLVKEARSGASFEEISRQFSSVTASAGGKVETFWVKLAQLDPHVARALLTAHAGSITDPIRSNEGYTIIKVYDTHSAPGAKAKEKPVEEKPKDTEVSLKEILLKLKPDASGKEADVMLKIGEEVAKNPGTCEDKTVANIKDLNDFDIEVSFSTQNLSEMTPALKTISESLKPGQISTPFASYEGIRLYMLCSKKETDAKPVDRDQVYHMLVQQKMELEAQKYMRNLRREVFIDIR